MLLEVLAAAGIAGVVVYVTRPKPEKKEEDNFVPPAPMPPASRPVKGPAPRGILQPPPRAPGGPRNAPVIPRATDDYLAQQRELDRQRFERDAALARRQRELDEASSQQVFTSVFSTQWNAARSIPTEEVVERYELPPTPAPAPVFDEQECRAPVTMTSVDTGVTETYCAPEPSPAPAPEPSPAPEPAPAPDPSPSSYD